AMAEPAEPEPMITKSASRFSGIFVLIAAVLEKLDVKVVLDKRDGAGRVGCALTQRAADIKPVNERGDRLRRALGFKAWCQSGKSAHQVRMQPACIDAQQPPQ